MNRKPRIVIPPPPPLPIALNENKANSRLKTSGSVNQHESLISQLNAVELKPVRKTDSPDSHEVPESVFATQNYRNNPIQLYPTNRTPSPLETVQTPLMLLELQKKIQNRNKGEVPDQSNGLNNIEIANDICEDSSTGTFVIKKGATHTPITIPKPPPPLITSAPVFPNQSKNPMELSNNIKLVPEAKLNPAPVRVPEQTANQESPSKLRIPEAPPFPPVPKSPARVRIPDNAHRRLSNKGWKSGYNNIPFDMLSNKRSLTDIFVDPNYSPFTLPRSSVVSLQSNESKIPSLEKEQSSKSLVISEPAPAPISKYSTVSSRVMLLQEKPSLENGSSQIEIDLADYLDGTKVLPMNDKYFDLECVTACEHGFVLKAHKISNTLIGPKTKPVYIKMIHRDSEAYKAAGKYVHPEHTELYLLQNRATHLPEFIEHYWTDDYLIIVTKAHGIRKSKLNLLGDTYHEVKWIYYFNQVV